MTWLAFGYNGQTSIAFLTGRLKAADYVAMLKDHLLSYGADLGGSEWIFQQDNATIHSARLTKKWFDDNNVALLEWPARSPDLNPVENVWGILSRRVYDNGRRQFSCVADLRHQIEEEWYNIGPEVFQRLVDSMKDRIFDVIANHGSSISY